MKSRKRGEKDIGTEEWRKDSIQGVSRACKSKEDKRLRQLVKLKLYQEPPQRVKDTGI